MVSTSTVAPLSANQGKELKTLVDGKISSSEKGAADGVVPLGSDSKISSIYLPSYVDDIIEAADFASPPGTGETGKVYVTLDTGKCYRWSGTVYVEVSPSDVNSVNGQVGVVVLDADDISDASTTNKFATASEKTKLGFISVTQAVDLDTLESDSHTHPNKTVLDNTTASFTTAQETKLGHISVTQAVDLDTMESDIAALQAGSATIQKTMVAGESFAANTTFAVRMAMSGETAGRVYKADLDASSSDKFYVIGLVSPTSAISAGDSVVVVMLGEVTLKSSDVAFESTEIGMPVHLKASGAFDVVSQISYSDNQASVRVGIVMATDKIL